MKIISTLKDSWHAVTYLFYPHVCKGCGSDVISDDNLLCMKCLNVLPYTHFAEHDNNPVERIFWGRLSLASATSEFYFAKGAIIQHLVHEFKYKGNKEVGMFLGAIMGNGFINNSRFNNVDALVPLPLYPNKEHKRGFNQAAILCNGIAEVMKIPVIKGNVIRKRFTATQTKKHRIERWENVEGSFEIKDQNQLQGKHILLVDDVVTTGATLEACGREILSVSNVKLSIATLAYASK